MCSRYTTVATVARPAAPPRALAYLIGAWFTLGQGLTLVGCLVFGYGRAKALGLTIQGITPLFLSPCTLAIFSKSIVYASCSHSHALIASLSNHSQVGGSHTWPHSPRLGSRLTTCFGTTGAEPRPTFGPLIPKFCYGTDSVILAQNWYPGSRALESLPAFSWATLRFPHSAGSQIYVTGPGVLFHEI